MVSNALMKILMTLFIAITCTGYGFAKDFVVVIDPGHGGKDVGAVGNKAKEKDINLGVALKLGDLIDSEYDDIEVVYTREGKFKRGRGTHPRQRSQIAFHAS